MRVKNYFINRDIYIYRKIEKYINNKDFAENDYEWIYNLWFLIPKINFLSKEKIYMYLTKNVKSLYEKYDFEIIKKINNVYKSIAENLSFCKIKNVSDFFDEVYDTLVDLSGIEKEIKAEHIFIKKWRF